MLFRQKAHGDGDWPYFKLMAMKLSHATIVFRVATRSTQVVDADNVYGNR